MARMHSRRKGKAGSTKPPVKEVPTWVRHKPEEVELVIVKLAKKGKNPSEIGTILRDTYGIPDVKTITNKKITEILEEHDLSKDVPNDLMNLMKKFVSLKKHLEENSKDKTAKRGLRLTESKIRRLVKYYKKSGKLSEDFKYDPKRVEMYLE